MPLALITRSARTATVLVDPGGAAFELPEPLAFALCLADGRTLHAGVATRTVVQIGGLEPSTGYVLACALGKLLFETAACAGCVDGREHGADPGADDNTAALQAAIDAVPAGGTMRVAGGRFATGPLFLKSDMTLLIEGGAELAAHGDWTERAILPEHDGDGRVVGTWEGLPAASFAALINGIGCRNLTLTGDGILDGGGDRGDWWQWPKETRRGARRPRTLFLAHCETVRISGLTVCNSPSWTVHPAYCRDLTAAALTILNPPDSPNTDGFNPESCEDTRLTGLHFSVGDDCIAIKAGKRDGARTGHLAPTRDLVIDHCLMERGHGAVVLGSEMSGGITDVTIRNCRFVGTDRGLRIKTRRGRGGRIARVDLSDVTMERVATAFSANGFYFSDEDGRSEAVQSRAAAPLDETTPRVEDIHLRNVTATNVGLAAAAVLGLPEAPFSGLRIEGLKVSFDPDAKADVPLMACGVSACRHAGLVADFADVTGDISLIDGTPLHAD